MLPNLDAPETASPRSRRRNLIAVAVAAVLAITGTVVAITASGGSRSGALVGTCDIGPNAQCPGAHLTGADLTGANLTGANLTRANLTRADLTGATVTGAYLTDANLASVSSSGIIGTPKTLPIGSAARRLDTALAVESHTI